jgi:DNA polymerase III subunit delta
MTPQEFLSHIQRPGLAPAYLFLGPETYGREICRRALIELMLPPEERGDGMVRHDLDETPLAEVIDDARSLSLFAPTRLIWVSAAEAALPRGKSVSAAGKEGHPSSPLAGYLKDPSPGVVLVFDAARYDFEGEDKAKLERVREFYSAVRAVVEFPRYTPGEAHALAQSLARDAGLKLDGEQVDLLVDALGAEASRIAAEIEKLRLYSGQGKKVSLNEISQLIPDARATTIFALVEKLGRKDRSRSLEVLETLVRQSEYLPLVLTFLGTQFHLALVVKEAGLKTAAQMQAHFGKLGIPMWRSRAEQVLRTASAFTRTEIEKALQQIFEADKALRDARPDDRLIMENFILRLTR